MAEKDAYLAIENAVEELELAPATVQETHKLKSLKTGLRTMSMLVKELDGQEHEPEVAEWLLKVRELAYEAQDVISSIVEEDNYQKTRRSKLGRLLSGGKPCKHVQEIKTIEKKFEKSHSSLSFNANEIVGFKDSQETLVRQITDHTRSRLQAVLVFGMPGSGKTTLAKMAFNDERIKNHFGRLVWVSFPEQFSLEELLYSLLRHTSSNYEIDHIDELKAKLSENLKGKRYLIVIDNMHSRDVLDELMSCFPYESTGSRLLLTSRESNLSTHQRISFSCEIEPLDVNHSWELLSRKVLKGENNPDLESLGKRMADKCKGSPRAILALAAILDGAEKTQVKWSSFLEGYDDLSNYLELPNELKFCLLYFGNFPEGSHISAKQMIQMWVAAGLVTQQGRNTPEEIGEQILNKLNSDSFIKVGKGRFNGSVKTCYIFSHFHSYIKKPSKEWMAIPSDSFKNALKSSEDYSRVQSLHCFNENASSSSISSADFRRTLQKFHHLRVLNLDYLSELENFPRELGKLRNLRYLKLTARNVKYLPPSIVNLQYLQTLDMRKSPLLSLPGGIWKLKFLRHLYVQGPTSLPKTYGFDKTRALPDLQTLSGVTPDEVLKWLIIRAKFPNVTKLRVCSTNPKLSLKFLNSLDHLDRLQSLRLEQKTELPDQNAFPLSLTKLTLMKTELHPKCIKTLEMLPNLRILQLLTKAICGEKIECSAGGFSQLEFLCIENVDVKKLTAQGAMQRVKEFNIKGCENLVIPDDHLKRVARYLTI